MMECSTPIPTTSTNLRRRTLMRLHDAAIEVVRVNDDSERSFRRSLVEQQKKNTSQVLNQSQSLNDTIQFTGEQEMNDHLKICTKLHAENKITSRVAWQLKIIDVLKVMSRKEGADTLQVASTSLDIGAKVYGIRVDDVHAACLKLANSMARMAGQEQDKVTENEDIDGVPENEENADRAKKKKKKIGRSGGPKNTIAKDKNSLLAPLQKLESVFFSTRIDSTLSTVENLFTNRLPMNKSCNKFMVLSKEKAWPSGPDEALQGLEGSKEFDKSPFPREGIICRPFQNLVLDKWDPEEEQNRTVMESQNENVVVFDDQGFPVPELDGTVLNNFDDDYSIHDDEVHEEEMLAQQIQREIPRIVDVVRLDEVEKSEYSYNSVIKLGNGKVIDQVWAGPSHWKLKFIRRDKVRYTGSENLDKKLGLKKRKRVEPEPAYWNEESVPELINMLDSLKRPRCRKKIHPANKVTLPIPDSSCTDLVENIHKFVTLPGTVLIPKSSEVENVENEVAEPDQIDDPEMDDGIDHMDHGMDHGDDIMTEDEVPISQQQNYMGDNLVEAPEYVPKSYVPYALQAKKMNMKKLKAAAWQLLTNNPSKDGEYVIPTNFSKLFADLPSVLPEAMRKELSCSLAFSALLHLCNEQQLKLTQLPEYKDFIITADIR